MADKNVKKGNFFSRAGKGIAKFFRETKNEAKKMIWPTPRTVFKNTGVVLVAIVIIGLFVFGLDTLFISVLGKFMSIAK